MATNEYGLDVNYFKGKFELLVRDIDRYTPQELHTELTRMAAAVRPEKKCPKCGAHALIMWDADNDKCTKCKEIISVC